MFWLGVPGKERIFYENHTGSWCGFEQVGVCLNNPDYIGAFAEACKERVSNYHVLRLGHCCKGGAAPLTSEGLHVREGIL